MTPADGGRTRLSADERRAQIIEAARRLFARSGFDATTTRQIAEEAAISDALIYRHFADKQAILRAVIDAGIARFASMAGPEQSRGDVPLAQRLGGLGGAFLAALDDERELIKLMVSQHHVLEDDQRFVTFIDRAAQGLGGAIDREYPPAPRDAADRGYLLARGFMGAIVAFAILQRDLGLDSVRAVDAGAYVRTLADTLVAGLGAAGDARGDARGDVENRPAAPTTG